jgi:hypothetical protein
MGAPPAACARPAALDPFSPRASLLPAAGGHALAPPRRSHPPASPRPSSAQVFGKGGVYMAILEEQHAMAAPDFRRLALSAARAPPGRGHARDDMLERAFWSALTVSPPLYGADTPLSLFDAAVPWGWNLRALGGCLLQAADVPDLPGVTSPMTYFGSWKSFFGWHKEDMDLYSVNYVHAGAPKVWYAVPPSAAARFDAMAASLFPEAEAACPAFLRHKDVMVSPKTLRAWGVPFVQARQRAGEFIVLNAAAYHAGFNLGFNVAEAVNFALPEWLAAGRAAGRCRCAALPDGVRLSLRHFFPDEEFSSSSDESGSESESESDSGDSESGSEASSSDEEAGEEEEAAAPAWRGAAAAKGGKGGGGAAKGAPRTPAAKAKPKPPATPAARGGKRAAAAAAAPAAKRVKAAAAAAAAAAADAAPATPAHARTPRPVAVPDAGPPPADGEVPRGALSLSWGAPAQARPVALVERDPATGRPAFTLVHRLARAAGKPGALWLGTLRPGADGLWRASAGARLRALGGARTGPRLARVRAEWVDAEGWRRAGWRLMTSERAVLAALA